jgi:hypothetical protein
VIIGSHFLLYSKNADADREFLRDVFEFRSVDAGRGWLIFALPPAEIAVHPAEASVEDGDPMDSEFYLMCDDLPALMKSLAAKNVECAPVSTERWGSRTSIRLPSGGRIGVYQPTHPTALDLR